MTPSSRRTVLLALGAITLVALAVRLWAAWTLNASVPDTPARLVGDEGGYDYLAWSLFEGRFFDWPGRTPTYPLFLAAVYAVWGHSYAAVLYAQAVVGAAAVPLTWLLARRCTTPAGALLAAAVVALHGPLVLHTRRLYTEVLFTVLLLLVLLALAWALDRPSARRLGAAGVVLGIANLCRPTLTLFPLVLPLLVPRAAGRARRAAWTAAYAAGLVLVTIPWTWHNWRTYGVVLPYSVSVAALWQGSPEMYHHERAGRSLLDVWANELNPRVNGGHDPFSIEGDRWFTRRAIASIRAEPITWLQYCLRKAAYFWIGTPMVDWPEGRFFSAESLLRWFSPLRVAAVILARLLPVAALVAVMVLAARRRLRPLLPLVALAGYLCLVHAVTYAEARYSDPLVPVLGILLGSAVAAVLPRDRGDPGIGRAEDSTGRLEMPGAPPAATVTPAAPSG